jgi:hypothetical protein
MPIQSILSANSPSGQQPTGEEEYNTLPTSGTEKGKRLPSIDMVYMGTFSSMEHHQNQPPPYSCQKQQNHPHHYAHSSPSSSNSISVMEYNRSLPSLQPMRTPFESNNTRSFGEGTHEAKEIIFSESASGKGFRESTQMSNKLICVCVCFFFCDIVTSVLDASATSSYMGLGKESVILNPSRTFGHGKYLCST